MMDDGPEWFAPKRYGCGSGTPISWQGWSLTLSFVGIVVGISLTLADKPLLLFSIVIPLTLLFMLIAARTTRGGWRWRWGERD